MTRNGLRNTEILISRLWESEEGASCLSVVISPRCLSPGEAGCGPGSPTIAACHGPIPLTLHVSVAEALLVLEAGQLGRVPRPRLVHVSLEALAGAARARDVQLAAAAAHCQLRPGVPGAAPWPQPPGRCRAIARSDWSAEWMLASDWLMRDHRAPRVSPLAPFLPLQTTCHTSHPHIISKGHHNYHQAIETALAPQKFVILLL